MTNTNLVHAMGRIDPKLIADAAPDVPQKKSINKTWVKWTSLAACFALVVLCAVPFVSNWLSNNPSIPDEISGLSPNDAELGFWCGIMGTDTIIKTTDSFTATITIGSMARNVERFIISIDTNDFDIEKSCADELIIGQDYVTEDYLVSYSSNLKASDLPLDFQLILSPKKDIEVYSGSVVITIEEYMPGGWGTAKTTIYYYGDANNICFSTESLENAKDIFAVANK